MRKVELSGWNHIVNTIIINHFSEGTFRLQELYDFEPYFSLLYPKNNFVKDKIRQTLQKLRDYDLLTFVSPGVYEYKLEKNQVEYQQIEKEIVYLLSNDSMPNWIKIGVSKSIELMLQNLNNTSVPTPFKLEVKIEMETAEKSKELVKSIHSVIDTINPTITQNGQAKSKDFFNMSVETGKNVFELVSKIMDLGQNNMQLF